VLRRILLLGLIPAAAFAAGPALDHAIALHTAGRPREALREYHALAGATDPAVAATALSNACVIQNDLGEYKAALPDCRRALEVCRTLGDPGTLGRALNNLGLVLESLGETAEAEHTFLEALEVNRKAGAAESGGWAREHPHHPGPLLPPSPPPSPGQEGESKTPLPPFSPLPVREGGRGRERGRGEGFYRRPAAVIPSPVLAKPVTM
jgi:tetratricopeptide (TPR) repeat protein